MATLPHKGDGLGKVSSLIGTLQRTGRIRDIPLSRNLPHHQHLLLEFGRAKKSTLETTGGTCLLVPLRHRHGMGVLFSVLYPSINLSICRVIL